MSGLYLGALLVSIAGLVVLDARLRLFLFAAPLRAAAVLAIGVGGFLLWDLAGIGLGIFFEGGRRLLIGLDLAPQLPVEEVCFLVLLCLTTMESALLAARFVSRRDRTTENSRVEPGMARSPGPVPRDLRRSDRRR